jgi:SH3-like domain-containing protein
VGELRACQGDWCQISLADIRGWVKRENLWGVGRNETFE